MLQEGQYAVSEDVTPCDSADRNDISLEMKIETAGISETSVPFH
jgi:hypothetical protein